MAQENANVLQAALHADQDPGPALRCVAATGIDLATLQFFTGPDFYRFSLVDPIADSELVVSLAGGVDANGNPREIGWRRVAGDTTQRAFEVVSAIGALRWSIQFWRVPPIGPSAPFASP